MTHLQLDSDPEIIELLREAVQLLREIKGDPLENKLYNLKETALMLGISYTQAREYASRGHLKGMNVGTGKNTHLRFSIEDIDAFKEGRK